MPVQVLVDLRTLAGVFRIPVVREVSRFVKIPQNCMALKQVDVSVSNRGHFGIRVDFLELLGVLLHLEDADLLELEGHLVNFEETVDRSGRLASIVAQQNKLFAFHLIILIMDSHQDYGAEGADDQASNHSGGGGSRWTSAVLE